MGEGFQEIELGGAWRFQLDPEDRGRVEEWFKRELQDRFHLPGMLQAQGFGEDVSLDTNWTGRIVDRSYFTDPRYAPYRKAGNIKVPFWLQPEKHYAGVAWYQRDVAVPSDWVNRRITLSLERPHWGTIIWVEGREIGSNDSLSTPHEYDLTSMFHPGRTHRLTLRIENRMLINVGKDSHSVSDHTQTNWNGVVGTLKLVATPSVSFDDVRVFPDCDSKRVTLAIDVANVTQKTQRGMLSVVARCYNTDRAHCVEPLIREVEFHPGENAIKVDYRLGPDVQLWDEFSPALYHLILRFESARDAAMPAVERIVSFGMREIGLDGTQFTVNGRKIFLRGTLECCVFPQTGYPPTDVEPWRRVIEICKTHGLNHIRFHSWCPPEAAFQAADELGFYYQVECASWAGAGQDAEVGSDNPLDEWLIREGERIIRAYGNHPSFVLMAYGNEPAGPRHEEYLRGWLEHFKRLDPRRKYTSASGWPILAESEFHVTPEPRIQHWEEQLRSRIHAHPPDTTVDYRDSVARFKVPVISHEIGQWCVYPNFEEIPKYTGFLKARNFEIFRDFLEANHMGDRARDFLMASGKLQTLCYKEEIESALRTSGMGGFQLLDLHDFPGQGTALVGVLDAFWDSKPYVTATEFRRFACETVPLARMAKRVFTLDETFMATIEVAHYGPTDLVDTPLHWKLTSNDGKKVADGDLPAKKIPTGQLTLLGDVAVPLTEVDAPAKLNLDVWLDGTGCANDWDIWVYPQRAAADYSSNGSVIRIVQSLDQATVEYLRTGGKVLLLIPPERVNEKSVIGFAPVFWNTAWACGQAPHTLGLLCEPEHPAFAIFPTEYHTNWQWWELVHRSAAMVLDNMPPKLKPIVQVIDTWFEARRLSLMFEACVGQGCILVSSIDLYQDLALRPVARQLRHSLLRYMSSDAFKPKVKLSVDSIRNLFRTPNHSAGDRG